MSILTLLVIAVSIVALLKVGSLLFDPPAYKQFTLAELEGEMTRIAHEWSEARESAENVQKQ
jgi:hypothetical protein